MLENLVILMVLDVIEPCFGLFWFMMLLNLIFVCGS